ncbi:hypothetical protein [Burkholderia stabilis]|uniref:hypothetical protein n=1 Tax=Burkholderia stabilis TaxID=95485 RepID=UPI000EFB81F8|nr:hypothetical protein [Burkholderia stabilis]
MKLETEGKQVIHEPKEFQVKRVIKSLKSYGSSSYASLTDAEGSYVQVAGGGASCMIERYDFAQKKRFRAFHDNPSAVRPDGAILSFRAGNIPMKSDEWFMSGKVEEVFVAFLNGAELPADVHWRDAPGF